MTERPRWDGGPGEHPDEGTIHAWLDEALDPESAERVATHVRSCSECSTLAAEARGLIAGASRVVSALDDVPAGTRPAWVQGEAGGGAAAGASPSGVAAAERSLWRRLRVTPARAAIAATILVALGVTLTQERVAMESVPRTTTLPAGHTEPRSAVAGAGIAETPAPAERKDGLLDSAVARNLAKAQGSPRMEAAREPAIPAAPPPSTAPVGDAPIAAAEQRVAAGRAAVQAQRDTAGVAPDRLRVRGEAAGATATRAADALAAAAPAREAPSIPAAGFNAAAKVSQGYSDAGAAACYRVESSQSGAMWGDQPMPLVVAVDPGPAVGTRGATVRSEATGPAMRASWMHSATDSVVISLLRVGLTGRIALGPDAGGRAGAATSGAITSSLEEASAKRADAASDVRAKAVGSPPAAASAGSVRVTMRPIPCPTR